MELSRSSRAQALKKRRQIEQIMDELAGCSVGHMDEESDGTGRCGIMDELAPRPRVGIRKT